MHRCVYLVGHRVPPRLAREQAALLAARDSVLSDWTAAEQHGFVESADRPLHITTARHRGRPRGVIVHTTKHLDSRDVTYRNGFPVTTPARTLIDLAEHSEDDGAFERAVEAAFARRQVNERQLRAIAARLPGRRGGARLRAYLDLRGDSGYTRSRGEDVVLSLLRSADLPPVHVNDRVEGYEVDFHFRGCGVIVELDSWRHHSDRRAFERDRAKWAALEARDYRVVPISWRQATEGRDATIARIAGAVALASAR
jgi:very-short-patch-repair endonuclease